MCNGGDGRENILRLREHGYFLWLKVKKKRENLSFKGQKVIYVKWSDENFQLEFIQGGKF